VTGTTRKYVLDTQLFIDAFRDQTANDALQQFHRGFAPFEYLSAVVAQELRAGVKRTRDRKALERNVLDVFERSGRMFALSASAWHRSGDLGHGSKRGARDRSRVEVVRERCPIGAVVSRGGLRARDQERPGFSAYSSARVLRVRETVARRSAAVNTC
jgi:predicted nucleic acid-binding protein